MFDDAFSEGVNSVPLIKVGGVPEHFNLPWHQAIEENAFRDIAVDVNFCSFLGGTGAMARALSDRKIDLAIMLTEGCLVECFSDTNIRMVKSFVLSPLIWGIHVKADSEIIEVDQIRDQRYAISRFGSGSHLMAIVDAAERNWPIDNMNFIQVNDLSGARESLACGQSDVFFWERFTTHPYVELGEFRRLGVRSALWPAFVVAGHAEFLQSHSDLVRAVLSVINQYCKQLMSSTNAIDLFSKRYGLAPEQVAQWFSLTTWSVDFDKPQSAINWAIEYLQRLKLIQVEPEALEKVEYWWHL